MKNFLLPILALSISMNVFAETLDLGNELPEVTVSGNDGKEVQLGEYKDEAYVLVYFYPKADTPGCTKQACSLRDEFEKIKEKGVVVFGVSKDNVKDQKAFAEKYDLPFTLLADTEGAVIKAFGVASFPVVGYPKRQAFLFKKGKLVWRDLTASTDKQAADVLAFLAE